MNHYNLADSRSPRKHHRQRLHPPIHPHKALIHSIANVGIVPGEVMLSGGNLTRIEICNFRAECIHNGNFGIPAVCDVKVIWVE